MNIIHEVCYMHRIRAEYGKPVVFAKRSCFVERFFGDISVFADISDGRFDTYEGKDSISFKNWDDDATIAFSVEKLKVNYQPLKKVKEI